MATRSEDPAVGAQKRAATSIAARKLEPPARAAVSAAPLSDISDEQAEDGTLTLELSLALWDATTDGRIQAVSVVKCKSRIIDRSPSTVQGQVQRDRSGPTETSLTKNRVHTVSHKQCVCRLPLSHLAHSLSVGVFSSLSVHLSAQTLGGDLSSLSSAFFHRRLTCVPLIRHACASRSPSRSRLLVPLRPTLHQTLSLSQK